MPFPRVNAGTRACYAAAMARNESPRNESSRGDPLRDGLKHNPFARLRAAEPGDASASKREPSTEEERRPPGHASSPPRATSTEPAPTVPPKSKSAQQPVASAAERIVVRRERKGHGGKAVTIAAGAGLDGHDVEQLARDAAKALGTGARVEDGALVVQGEQIERLIAWLSARGFTSLSRGN